MGEVRLALIPAPQTDTHTALRAEVLMRALGLCGLNYYP
jgi:hypothetical protein